MIDQCNHESCNAVIEIITNDNAHIELWTHVNDDLSIILKSEYIPHSTTQTYIRKHCDWKLVYFDIRENNILMFRKI